MRRFIFYIVPLLGWMAVIFNLSAIPSDKLMPMPSDTLLFWAHKVTHMVEYSILGGLGARAKNQYNPGGPYKILIAVLFLFAVSDEYHQSFTPGRTPSFLDVIGDTVYGAAGILVYTVFTRRWSR